METQKEIYEFGKFRLDVAECTLFRENRAVPLEPQVYKTLLVLVSNADHLVEKGRLLDEIWSGAEVEEGNLVRNISLLRKALGQRSTGERYIETIPKRGYRFVAQVRSSGDHATDPITATAGPQQNLTAVNRVSAKLHLPKVGTIYIVATAIVGCLLLAGAVMQGIRGIATEQPGDA